MPLIERHRRCAGCGYDLFGLTTPCACPECGRQVRVRRRDNAARNPRRQAGRYRALIRRQRASLRALPIAFVFCAVVSAAGAWFRWPTVLIIMFSLPLPFIPLAYLAERARLRQYEATLGEVEAKTGANSAAK
jgi:hypothetical protein